MQQYRHCWLHIPTITTFVQTIYQLAINANHCYCCSHSTFSSQSFVALMHYVTHFPLPSSLPFLTSQPHVVLPYPNESKSFSYIFICTIIRHLISFACCHFAFFFSFLFPKPFAICNLIYKHFDLLLVYVQRLFVMFQRVSWTCIVNSNCS